MALLTFSAGSLEVRVEYVPAFSFAHQQAALPLLHEVAVENTGALDEGAGSIRVRLDPAMAAPWNFAWDGIGAGGIVRRENPDMPLSPTALAETRERVAARLIASVESAELQEPAAADAPLDILPYNHWAGTARMPELLAAFVTPEQPAVLEALDAVAEALRRTTGNPALDGYQQKDPKRVYRCVEAVYRAMQAREIRYALPGVGFEESGQRIRMAEEAWSGRFGTCLDLVVLAAACLEQMGLRAVICLEKEHAYAGCWLVESGFATSFVDDLQAVRKHVDLNEMVVFETTLACAGSEASFAAAEARARTRLTAEEAFVGCLDLWRARKQRIHPLPVRVEEGRLFLAPAPEAGGPQTFAPVDETGLQDRFAENGSVETARSTPKDRVDNWLRHLLDLTMRNRLLNFRPTGAKVIRLWGADLARLEDRLATEKTLRLKAAPAADERDRQRHLNARGEDFLSETARSALDDGILLCEDPANKLETRLTGLSRDATLALEEGGTNILYVAIGMLEWRESKDAAKVHLAPILLVPVALERRSVRAGFTLRRLDEETRLNVTLLELLRRDFQLSIQLPDPLPEDDAGLDVPWILRRFKEEIKDSPGFEVREEAWLATFSYTKYLLWKDLKDRRAALRASPVVRHLLETPGQPFAEPLDLLEASELDRRLPPKDTFCVVEADGFQLAAVANAGLGQSFVLFGPPGTGKSQTITNLIAHCLALGKRVLFVAEKRAALDVVHERLAKAGLGPFVLELHSHRAGKGQVFSQLREALDAAAGAEPDEWVFRSGELETVRANLNAWVEAVHRRYPSGLSAFEAYGRIMGVDRAALAPLRIPGILEQSREAHAAAGEAVAALALRLRDFPRPVDHPLAGMEAQEWSPLWEDRGVAAAAALAKASECFGEALHVLPEDLREFGRAGEGTAWADRSARVAWLGSLTDLPTVPEALLDSPHAQRVERLEAWLSLEKNLRAAEAALPGWDLDALSTTPFAEWIAVWRQAGEKWWLPRLLARRKVNKSLAPFTSTSLPAAIPEMDALLVRLLVWKEAASRYAGVQEEAVLRLGNLWSADAPDGPVLLAALNALHAVELCQTELAGARLDQLEAGRAILRKILRDALPWLAPGGPWREKIEAVRESWEALTAAWEDFAAVFAVACVPERLAAFPADAVTMAERFLSERTQWARWTRLQAALAAVRAHFLGPLVDRALAGDPAPDDLRDAFIKAHAWNFLRELLNDSRVLSKFSGEGHMAAITKFRSLDHHFLDLAAQMTIRRLRDRFPHGLDGGTSLGEVAILHRELAKQRRQLPVRQLVQQIPNALARLKPCFLMSPLSVAQYLDPEHAHFDLVVFDEASQIPVWDAIGAIARARQAIVVGDPKQLPPTAFFERADADDAPADADIPEDLESILDECLASKIPHRHLRWHYRSREESLIAFSNHHYYGNQLLTFPSPKASEQGVRLHPVPDGLYDKGRSRTNRQEAEAVVDFIREHVLNPERGSLSIGVVTFNQQQQTLISDLLDEARAADDALDEAIAQPTGEALFIKNLENVQGDERDIIVFSITFAPDAAGKLSHNFGPLNNQGGERRLNVAVTRARHEIHVFATLRAEQIDLTRTNALGVRHLKHYLEYAAKGPRSLAAATTEESGDAFDSPFEAQVAEVLRSAGWTVRSQVGCSDFRIDLGIVHPGAPGTYLLGIECDGATYHRSATARDRDRLRQAVLEGLGWRIHRIWSTDWFHDFAREKERLLAVVAEAAESGEPTPGGSPPPPPPVRPKSKRAPATPSTEAIAPPPDRRCVYRLHSCSPEKRQPASPYDAPALAPLRRQIEAVVRTEEPISADLLCRRLAPAWGFSSVSAKFRRHCEENFPACIQKTTPADGRTFLWITPPSDFKAFRVPDESDPATKRDLRDIPPEEIANVFLDLLEKYFRVEADELLRETIRLLGFQQLTAPMRAQLNPLLETLREQGRLIAEQDHWTLPGSA